MKNRFHSYFMREARNAASMSKDPSTQVGAVIVKDRHVVGSGWNGFPKGINDDRRLWNREEKLELIIHAEFNAILDAGHRGHNGTLYLYGFRSAPCGRCIAPLIQIGVREVYACGPELPERWVEATKRSLATLHEVGGQLIIIDEAEL
jgi:dCMP deaminase